MVSRVCGLVFALLTVGAGEQLAPVGVEFLTDTLRRSDGHGDNWCLTWAADGSQVTSMCDGDWLGEGRFYHNRLYRIRGSSEAFERDVLSSFPDFSGEEGSWFGYGILSVNGDLYATASKTPGTSWSGPFRGLKLLKSQDDGATWYRVDRQGNTRLLAPADPARNEVTPAEMFFLEEGGLKREEQVAYPFSFVAFAQCGRDATALEDDFIYIYSPEGAFAHQLLLARAPKATLGTRSSWEYFTGYRDGQPTWTGDLNQRKPVHVFPEKSEDGRYFGWYSWLPSVAWNQGLGLFIMVNGGTYAGRGMTASDGDYFDRWMHTETGSLGFWYSETPHGPWHRFFYQDYWTVDNPKNRTYQPKVSPKWTGADGKEMVLIWSDAMKDDAGKSHTVNYRWNQMQIRIVIGSPAAAGSLN